MKSAGITAQITNVAKSADGDFYWKIVNDGRGPIVPVSAKALHWFTPEGEEVFSDYSGPVAPRHILEKALPGIRQIVKRRAKFASVSQFGRPFVVAFVNALAATCVERLKKFTPVVTGKLQDSYRIKKAK